MRLTPDEQKSLVACLPSILETATEQYKEFSTTPDDQIKNLTERSKAAKAVLSHILLILKAAKSLSDKGVMEKDLLQAMQNAATRAAGLEDVQAYLKIQNMDPPS